MASLKSKKRILKHNAKIRLQYKRKGSEKFENDTENTLRKEAKKEAKQSEMQRKFCLFVSQTEAKIMRNGLCFASISHEAKTKFKRKRDTLIARDYKNYKIKLRKKYPQNLKRWSLA
jgi:hypothetical protein